MSLILQSIKKSNYIFCMTKTILAYLIVTLYDRFLLFSILLLAECTANRSTGAILRWAGGQVPRFSCCPPPQIQKLADRSDVISEVPKCKIKFSLTDVEGACCPLPGTPPSLSALPALFLRVSGSNPLQSWQPY